MGDVVEYLIGVVALFIGVVVGLAAMWGIGHRRIAAAGRERDDQIEQARELERQLHAKECECLDRLATQRRELMTAQQTELREAVSETREAQRADFELQSKLFSVKVSPYVEISDSRHLMRTRYRSVTGYQYQLLVNGIPAFAPHVVQEHVKTEYAVDQEQLIQLARETAQAAVQLYAGGASQFVEIATPIVRQLGRSKQPDDA